MIDEQTINIRDVQHYLYCPRRFALMRINCDWKENASVVRANLLHIHVHDGSHSFSDSQKIVRSDIAVYNDEPQYMLFGIPDCIEFLRSKSGINIPLLDGCYNVRIIEYKPRAPKDAQFNEADAIQVFAQKLCADYVWKCNCEAYIYYSDTRKRVKLPFDTEFEHYDDMLRSLLIEMRKTLTSVRIPPRRRGQHCSGCSISELCFSKEQPRTVKDQILSLIKEDSL